MHDAPATGTAPAPQPVVLVDRIAWQWYLITAVIPFLGALIGFIAGIVFMARSKIGPAFALWATAWLAAGVWTGIGWGIVAGVAIDNASSSVEISHVIPPPSSDPVQATPDPAPDPANSVPDQSSTATDVTDADSNRSSTRTKTCGNLTVAAGSTTCAFAQNVFYEYWTATDASGSHQGSIDAYSPRLDRWLKLTCKDGDPVVCATDAGAVVQMPREALDAYNRVAAKAYAAHHIVSR